MREQGFGMIEVIITITFVAVVALALGKTLMYVNQVSSTSLLRSEALGYVQEDLEKINIIQNDLFACRCATDSCSGTSCTATDGQSCEMFPAYQSCWIQYPRGLSGNTEFYLDSNLVLQPLSPGATEQIATDHDIRRKIVITNAYRDADGNIAVTGTEDYSTKIVEVIVTWIDRGDVKQVSGKHILTAWRYLD